MADAFVGEIRLLPYTFPPQDWLWCSGSNIPVAQFQALYAVIGLTYGGSPNVNFNLPNLTGTVPIGVGAGPGLTQRVQSPNPLGAKTVTLISSQVAGHTHTVTAKYLAGTPGTVQSSLLATPVADSWMSRAVLQSGTAYTAVASYATTGSPDTAFPTPTITPGGGVSQPAAHENRQPFLPLNFCICTSGWFPTPSD